MDTFEYHRDDEWTLEHSLNIVAMHGADQCEFMEAMIEEYGSIGQSSVFYAANVLEWLGY